jgi:hypothetical protein
LGWKFRAGYTKLTPVLGCALSSIFDYDIGLVLLVQPVVFTSYIVPICLPIREHRHDTYSPLVISGPSCRRIIERKAKMSSL